MASSTAFTVSIQEPLTQSSLDRLREALGLEPEGRLTDDWDAEFGYKDLKGDGADATEVTLCRADGRPWFLDVTYPDGNPPSDAELAQWRTELIEGIRAAGLTPVPSE
ncbi:hypothetical protein [Nocardioides speluncae]|uniref:hypothetical protein n=1 Tax=Nocardioides speluncae TaxID=2670337 RepID=UPI000D68A3F4|nr:hypothetical protein [Nocardioides speluncae]